MEVSSGGDQGVDESREKERQAQQVKSNAESGFRPDATEGFPFLPVDS
jgi:hypothetical protein